MSNYTPETATVVTALPYEDTLEGVQGFPEGTGYPSTCFTNQYHAAWYTYTTGANEVVLAVLASKASDEDTNFPVMAVYTGTPGALTQYTLSGTTFCGSSVAGPELRLYFKIPVTPSTQYYFQIIDSLNVATPATVVFGLQADPGQLRYRNAIFCLPEGTDKARIINKNLARVALIEFAGTNTIFSIHANLPGKSTGNFYLATNDDTQAAPSQQITLHAFTPAGVRIDGWNMPHGVETITGICLAVNREGTIAYWASEYEPAGPIRVLGLINGDAMPNLSPGFPGQMMGRNGYVAEDGSILFLYADVGTGLNGCVRRFTPAGVLLHTYTFAEACIVGRMVWADDAPGSFWVRRAVGGGTIPATATRLRLSDGVVLQDNYVAVNTVAEIGDSNNETFGVGRGSWFLKVNEGLLFGERTPGFPVGLTSSSQVAPGTGAVAFSTFPLDAGYQLAQGAVMAPAAPAPVVIAPPTRQWKLYRCDTKPRAEETA